MKNLSLQEFKPTIYFLLKFIGIYVVGNLVYGWWVSTYSPGPDPFTHVVTKHVSGVLHFWFDVSVYDYADIPTCGLVYKSKSVLGVYEGCNGLNTAIIFVAFIIAFGPLNKTTAWFIPLGFLVIHVANLLRITLLFFVALYRPDSLYFIHKYLFTAFLYAIIFALWMWWIRKNPRKVAAHGN